VRLRQAVADTPNDKPRHRSVLKSAVAQSAVERLHSGEALQLLTGRLLQAQEEERRRIARELHDGLNQQLALFAIELGLLARRVPREASALTVEILNLRQRAEDLSKDLRQITHQLHPAVLEHLGLISALRSLCDEITRSSGVRVWFRMEQEMGQVRPEISICLYRITQEALRNICRHSGAGEAWVSIGRSQSSIQLSIIDKGVGFVRDATRTTGLGLVSMEERVLIVRGQIQIKSSPEDGTAIRIQVPNAWKGQNSELE